jgi:hypothetical protein
MKKIDYTDLDAAESISHIFGFFGPLLLVIFCVVVVIAAVVKMFV